MPSPLIKILGICGGLATIGGGVTAICLNTNPAKTKFSLKAVTEY